MRRSRLSGLAVLLLLATAMGCATPQQPESNEGSMPLLFEDDFEDGDMNEWEATDPSVWRVTEMDGRQVLELFEQSDYEPPVRSPHNMALVRDLWVSDFILEARVKSTEEQYGHQDVCFFFGWQDPAHFYYTHLAPAPDPHAHSIFLVNNEPRVSIGEDRSDGMNWDDEYHTVRVVRDADAGTIEIYIDDMTNPVMHANDDHFDYGRVGVGTFDDVAVYDYVRVWGEEVENPGSVSSLN